MVSKTEARPQVATAAKPTPQPKPSTLKTPVDVTVLLMTKGGSDFVIHQKGCRAYKAQKAKSAYADTQDYELTEVVNQREVITEVWDDIIAEQWNEDPKNENKDYADASWGWLAKNGFVHSVKFHTCLDGLPQQAKGQANAKTANTKKAAKNELATLVAEAAGQMLQNLLGANLADPEDPYAAAATLVTSGFASDEDIRQCVAQWLHGMPVDRERFLKVLPRPDRSDWRAELDAANSNPNSPAETDEDPGSEPASEDEAPAE